MLKTRSPFKQTEATSDFIDELQDKYARLKIEQRLNKVDLYDAEHGGGFNALRQAEAEQEDIEIHLEATEDILREHGVTPTEKLPEDICSQQGLEKHRRFLEIFCPCGDAESPQF